MCSHSIRMRVCTVHTHTQIHTCLPIAVAPLLKGTAPCDMNMNKYQISNMRITNDHWHDRLLYHAPIIIMVLNSIK